MSFNRVIDDKVNILKNPQGCRIARDVDRPLTPLETIDNDSMGVICSFLTLRQQSVLARVSLPLYQSFLHYFSGVTPNAWCYLMSKYDNNYASRSYMVPMVLDQIIQRDLYDVRDNNEWALKRAARSNNVKLATMLMSVGADPTCTYNNINLRNMLTRAVRDPHTKRLKYETYVDTKLKKKIDESKKQGQVPETSALAKVAERDNIDMLKLFMSHVASRSDVNGENVSEILNRACLEAMHAAIRSSAINAIRYLLTQYPNVRSQLTVKDLPLSAPNSTLHELVSLGMFSEEDLLTYALSHPTSLCENILAFMLAHRGSSDVVVTNINSMLMRAARWKNTAMVKTILGHPKVDPNCYDHMLITQYLHGGYREWSELMQLIDTPGLDISFNDNLLLTFFITQRGDFADIIVRSPNLVLKPTDVNLMKLAALHYRYNVVSVMLDTMIIDHSSISHLLLTTYSSSQRNNDILRKILVSPYTDLTSLYECFVAACDDGGFSSYSIAMLMYNLHPNICDPSANNYRALFSAIGSNSRLAGELIKDARVMIDKEGPVIKYMLARLYNYR